MAWRSLSNSHRSRCVVRVTVLPRIYISLSELYDCAQASSKPPTGGLAALRSTVDDISLTLDPAFADTDKLLGIDDKFRQKADAIFEKEQEFVAQNSVETASDNPGSRKQQLWVTENGYVGSSQVYRPHPLTMCLTQLTDGSTTLYRFLTQTRPDVSSPELYRPSPSQRLTQSQYLLSAKKASQLLDGASSAFPSPTKPPGTVRQPLGTLILETPDEGRGRLRRLRRGRASTSPESSPSPSPSPSKRPPLQERMSKDAFGALLNGAQRLGKEKDRVGRKGEEAALVRSEFVANEAEEEDDEDLLGWGGTLKRKSGTGGGAEDEEEGEDDGKDLEGMLDERDLDEEELARQKVIEKARCVPSPFLFIFR